MPENELSLPWEIDHRRGRVDAEFFNQHNSLSRDPRTPAPVIDAVGFLVAFVLGRLCPDWIMRDSAALRNLLPAAAPYE
jgi:hypothetical protein